MRSVPWRLGAQAAPLFCLALLPALSASGAELSRQEAEALLDASFSLSAAAGLADEGDFAGKPENVILAGLYCAWDAKHAWQAAQDRRADPQAPVIKAGKAQAGRSEIEVDRARRPALFRGRPEKYTAFASRRAVELAALTCTGHAVKEHRAPAGEGFLGDTLLDARGYFYAIGGIEVPIESPRLLEMKKRDGGYVLTGSIVRNEYSANPGARVGTFELVLAPGDAPGAWKRRWTKTLLPLEE